jgi:hypothetical protein
MVKSRGVCHVAGGGRRPCLTLAEIGLSMPTIADVTIPAVPPRPQGIYGIKIPPFTSMICPVT